MYTYDQMLQNCIHTHLSARADKIQVRSIVQLAYSANDVSWFGNVLSLCKMVPLYAARGRVHGNSVLFLQLLVSLQLFQNKVFKWREKLPKEALMNNC